MLLAVLLVTTLSTGFTTCFKSGDGTNSNIPGSPKIDNTKQATIWLRISGDPGATAIFHCTGAILSQQHVITAAVCVDSLNETDLLVSTSKDHLSATTTFSTVLNVTARPEYDLAVLRVDDAFFPASSAVDLVDDHLYIASGDKCIASGWIPGTDLWMYEGVLYLTSQDCTVVYKQLSTPIQDVHVCSTPELGNGTCTVGLGWTLMCDGRLAGVFTWTHYSCEQPSVYAGVGSAQAWLLSFRSASTRSTCNHLLVIVLTALMWRKV